MGDQRSKRERRSTIAKVEGDQRSQRLEGIKDHKGGRRSKITKVRGDQGSLGRERSNIIRLGRDQNHSGEGRLKIAGVAEYQ